MAWTSDYQWTANTQGAFTWPVSDAWTLETIEMRDAEGEPLRKMRTGYFSRNFPDFVYPDDKLRVSTSMVTSTIEESSHLRTAFPCMAD